MNWPKSNGSQRNHAVPHSLVACWTEDAVRRLPDDPRRRQERLLIRAAASRKYIPDAVVEEEDLTKDEREQLEDALDASTRAALVYQEPSVMKHILPSLFKADLAKGGGSTRNIFAQRDTKRKVGRMSVALWKQACDS